MSRVETRAFCWRIERRDGFGLALTSHDEAVVRGGITYETSPGMTPASIRREGGLSPSSTEIHGAISNAAISDDDLAAGRWDGAALNLSVCEWDGAGEPQTLAEGRLGSSEIEGDAFRMDLKGVASLLDRPICPRTSPTCRADLGDERCRIDLSGRAVRATVMSVAGNRVELDRAVDDEVRFGRIRFQSGKANGLTSIILSVDGAWIALRTLPPVGIRPGDRCLLDIGCDKTLSTCRDRFANAANFRGEPHLPGNDLLTRYPGN